MTDPGIPLFEEAARQVWPHIETNFYTVALFTMGIVIYSVAIFHFYRFVAPRDVFGFNMQTYLESRGEFKVGFMSTLTGALAYGLIFPLFVFLWYSGFALLLFFMAKNIEVGSILLISIAVVSAVRITAYYKEELSKDIAKMLPFVLLTIAIIDPNFFSIELVKGRIDELVTFVPKIAGFAMIMLMLEWFLRILLFVKRFLFGLGQQEADEG